HGVGLGGHARCNVGTRYHQNGIPATFRAVAPFSTEDAFAVLPQPFGGGIAVVAEPAGFAHLANRTTRFKNRSSEHLRLPSPLTGLDKLHHEARRHSILI